MSRWRVADCGALDMEDGRVSGFFALSAGVRMRCRRRALAPAAMHVPI